MIAVAATPRSCSRHGRDKEFYEAMGRMKALYLTAMGP